MEEEILTVSELCKLLKISRTTADRWRKEGMPFIKHSKSVRFNNVEVLKWLKENHKN